jgi:hypothetical protein
MFHEKRIPAREAIAVRITNVALIPSAASKKLMPRDGIQSLIVRV